MTRQQWVSSDQGDEEERCEQKQRQMRLSSRLFLHARAQTLVSDAGEGTEEAEGEARLSCGREVGWCQTEPCCWPH